MAKLDPPTYQEPTRISDRELAMTRGDNERQYVTNQVTPIAAKNAAFLVLASKYPGSGLVYSEGFTRALDEALEAAAPWMLREAKECAYDEGYEDGDRYNKNPYRQHMSRDHRHVLVTIYSRPWWNWFRKTYSIRCWTCDIEVAQ